MLVKPPVQKGLNQGDELPDGHPPEDEQAHYAYDPDEQQPLEGVRPSGLSCNDDRAGYGCRWWWRRASSCGSMLTLRGGVMMLVVAFIMRTMTSPPLQGVHQDEGPQA
jgi:hypothetical protein